MTLADGVQKGAWVEIRLCYRNNTGRQNKRCGQYAI